MLAADGQEEETLKKLLENSEAEDILNEGGDDQAAESSAGKAGEGEPLSPRAALEANVRSLEASLKKKSAQVEKLVASHKSLMRATAERERKTGADAAKLRALADAAEKARQAEAEQRRDSEQQLEAMRLHLSAQVPAPASRRARAPLTRC